jgi:hypothetical protein
VPALRSVNADQLTLAFAAPPASGAIVHPSASILHLGCRAPEVPRHTLPMDLCPTALGGDGRLFGRFLTFAESQIRFNHGGPVLDPASWKGCSTGGSYTPAGWFEAQTKGVVERRNEITVGWRALSKALAAQRDREPEIARQRDLAEAYRLYIYYAHAYSKPEDTAHVLTAYGAHIRDLGGDPTLVPVDEGVSWVNQIARVRAAERRPLAAAA